MNKPDNELINLWKEARPSAPSVFVPIDGLIARAKAKQQYSLRFHGRNMAILLATVIGLLAFFRFVAPLQTLFSQIGIGMMIGALLLRMLIEGYSITRATQMDISANAKQATNEALSFLRFRKTVHGWVTIALVIMYSAGFFLLTPEFSQYFDPRVMVLFDGSYLVGALVLILLIRRGIKKEVAALTALVAVKEEMNRGEQ